MFRKPHSERFGCDRGGGADLVGLGRGLVTHHGPKRRLKPDSEFTFLRLIYSGSRLGAPAAGGWSWQTDYPKADLQFLYGLENTE